MTKTKFALLPTRVFEYGPNTASRKKTIWLESYREESLVVGREDRQLIRIKYELAP